MRKVLACIDGSEASGRAFERALQLVDKEKGELIAVHVMEVFTPEETSSPLTTFLKLFNPLEDRMEHLNNVMEKEKAEELEQNYRGMFQLASSQLKDRFTYTTIESPDAREAICKLIPDHDIDLCVMGSRGTGSLERMLVGSVSEHVMRFGKCSVMIVR
ncbi:hypothetical protein QOT17_003873 [Balamuthia mandrillaris]